MKKVTRFFAIAAIAFGMTMMFACGGNDPDNPDNPGGGGNGGGNTENLPTTLDETFANGIPGTWTNIDADGDGAMWMSTGGQLADADGNGAVYSQSYDNNIGPLTPDNYLVTPKLYIEEGATLSYEVGAVDANYYRDHYSVLVGNVENGVFKAVGTLVNEDVPSPNTTTRTFSLSDYKGQSLSIAFRHFDCIDMYIMTIDNIKVTK